MAPPGRSWRIRMWAWILVAEHLSPRIANVERALGLPALTPPFLIKDFNGSGAYAAQSNAAAASRPKSGS